MIDFRDTIGIRDLLIKRKFEIEELERRPEIFYLTGSYYFGGHRRRSDLDLIVDAGVDVSHFNGAHQICNSSYLDDFTSEVWRIEGTYNNRHIDIQVSKPGALKNKLLVARIMKTHKLVGPFQTKEEKRRMWNAFAEVFGVSDSSKHQTTDKITVIPRNKPKHICPKCGASGDNLGDFAFYCSNTGCENYHP